MKKIFYILFMIFSFSILTNADTLYFWIENEDLATINLADNVENSLYVYLIDSNTGEKTQLNTVVAEGNGYWKYNSETKKYDFVTSTLDPSDFGHKTDATVNGYSRYVYSASGSYNIDDENPPDWIFTIEAIVSNGDIYGTSIAESIIWDKDDRWMWPYKDHVCQPIHLDYKGTIPEPNSTILILIGLGCLMLVRKRVCQ